MRGPILAAAALLWLGAGPAGAQKTLRVCDDVEEPASLNPYLVFSEKAHTLLQQMLEGLVRFDAEGRIKPALAESWERVDDRTMRFHLRRGVVFHDGEPFDADAVKFSLEKYVDPKTHFLGAGFVETISSVAVVDDHTVDVITRRADGLLLNRLAAWIHIVAPRYYRKAGDAGFAAHPVGTGPFEFGAWAKGATITMPANKRYWMPRTPDFDVLEFVYMPAEQQVDGLLSGKLDVLTNLPGTRTLDAQRSPRTYVIKKPTFYTIVGNFNLKRKPFSDERVRKAVNLAVDRSGLVRFEAMGNGIPLGTISLPGEFGHNDAVQPYPYDPAAARRLLAEAGYPGGLTIKLLLKANAERAGGIIARQWEDIGVRVATTVFTDTEIPEYFKGSRQMDWDMMITDIPDPMNDAFFIRSIYLDPASPFSFQGDPAVGAALDRLVGSLAPQERRRISEDLDRYIHDHFLALPTYQRIRTYGVRRGVSFTPYISGMPYFFGARIDGGSR